MRHRWHFDFLHISDWKNWSVACPVCHRTLEATAGEKASCECGTSVTYAA